MKPVRLQLSRKARFNLQDASMAINGLPAVSVARPGKWGNPFIVGQHGNATECVAAYRRQIEHQRGVPGADGYSLNVWINQLRGKNLACWCRLDQPCHADVLLEMANG